MDCVEGALQLVKSVNEFIEHEFAKQREDAGEVDACSRVDEISSMSTTKDWLARTEHWECARHFFSRPYFSRCWVLKEGSSLYARDDYLVSLYTRFPLIYALPLVLVWFRDT
ncbi:hypothetical protein F5X98DRAFT_379106 [Xylaria grammica]|nr:hypothetical protein F5X98DRAFT_379106 [Xylaria grammica]